MPRVEGLTNWLTGRYDDSGGVRMRTNEQSPLTVVAAFTSLVADTATIIYVIGQLVS